MGDICYSETDEKFMYREDYEAKRPKGKLIVRVSGQDIHDDDPIDIDMGMPDLASLEFEDEDNEEDIIVDINDGYDNYDINITAEYPDDIYKLIENARNSDIQIMLDETTTGGVLFDLVANMESDRDQTVHPSEPRNGNISHGIESYRRFYTLEETKLIAKMSSGAVASRFNCPRTIATDMVRNAKRILGIPVKFKDTYYRFTCYFNEGKTVDDVAEIYPNIKRSIIESNYKAWLINGNNETTKFAVDKWNNIIESKDYNKMIDGFFGHTIYEFGVMEKCTKRDASNIMFNLHNALCINPFVSAGFDKESFDRDALFNIASDALNSSRIEDQITAELYDITLRLQKAYIESYNYHSHIKSGEMPIPDSVKESDKDYFMSLIWNRFNRAVVITNERKLSDAQKMAIKNESKRDVALLFMISYDRACRLIRNYRG